MPANSRIIIDTNLWISFLLTKNLSKFDTLFRQKDIVLLFSKELLEEFVEVAKRQKFKNYFSLSDLEELLTEINRIAEFIEVNSTVNICRDTKDNFLLALAKDGKANFLITGDKDLLSIGYFKKTQIITLTEFFAEV